MLGRLKISFFHFLYRSSTATQVNFIYKKKKRIDNFFIQIWWNENSIVKLKIIKKKTLVTVDLHFILRILLLFKVIKIYDLVKRENIISLWIGKKYSRNPYPFFFFKKNIRNNKNKELFVLVYKVVGIFWFYRWAFTIIST